MSQRCKCKYGLVIIDSGTLFRCLQAETECAGMDGYESGTVPFCYNVNITHISIYIH